MCILSTNNIKILIIIIIIIIIVIKDDEYIPDLRTFFGSVYTIPLFTQAYVIKLEQYNSWLLLTRKYWYSPGRLLWLSRIYQNEQSYAIIVLCGSSLIRLQSCPKQSLRFHLSPTWLPACQHTTILSRFKNKKSISLSRVPSKRSRCRLTGTTISNQLSLPCEWGCARPSFFVSIHCYVWYISQLVHLLLLITRKYTIISANLKLNAKIHSFYLIDIH